MPWEFDLSVQAVCLLGSFGLLGVVGRAPRVPMGWGRLLERLCQVKWALSSL